MTKEIPLTQGKVALVDDEDYEWLVSMGRWYYHYKGYAIRNAPGSLKKLRMHRVITGCKEGETPDHKDGDKLNNRRSNLRVGTQTQNCYNSPKRKNTTSKFKGVAWNKRKSKWTAQIGFNGQAIHLGVFTEETAAAQAYDDKAIELFGEYAKLNFPKE